MNERRPEYLQTRKSMLSRIKNWDDNRSWQEFFDTYWKLIYGVALKSGLNEEEAQDVVQNTLVTVSKRIKDLQYDPVLGSFKGWLLTTTRWKIADQFRKRLPTRESKPEDTRNTSTMDRIPDESQVDLDAVWDEEWQKNLIDAALGKVRKKVVAKQYQIFDLYVVKNWPVAKVATTLGVSAAQVYLVKHRVSSLVRKEIKLLEKKARE